MRPANGRALDKPARLQFKKAAAAKAWDGRLRSQWDLILAAEGMPPELPQAGPRPRRDRDWADHFGGGDPYHRAQTDAVERIRLDHEVTVNLFAMLADIRWGRHDPTIEPLTTAEHAVFDLYCDGLAFADIAEQLGLARETVQSRFYTALSRFTPRRPEMKRTHTGRRSNRP